VKEVRVAEEALAPERLHLRHELGPVGAEPLERVGEQVLEVVRAGPFEATGELRVDVVVARRDLAEDGDSPRTVVHQRAVEVEHDDRRRLRALGPAAPQDGTQHGMLLDVGRFRP